MSSARPAATPKASLASSQASDQGADRPSDRAALREAERAEALDLSTGRCLATVRTACEERFPSSAVDTGDLTGCRQLCAATALSAAAIFPGSTLSSCVYFGEGVAVESGTGMDILADLDASALAAPAPAACLKVECPTGADCVLVDSKGGLAALPDRWKSARPGKHVLRAVDRTTRVPLSGAPIEIEARDGERRVIGTTAAPGTPAAIGPDALP